MNEGNVQQGQAMRNTWFQCSEVKKFVLGFSLDVYNFADSMNLNNMCKEKKRVEGSIGESPVRMYSHKEQRIEINKFNDEH